MEDAVHIDGVTKRFREFTAVDRLDLTVPKGSVYGFIGPNGSGKTTTLRMILRIFYPDEGRIAVLGDHEAKVADDRVGYLPEERGLYRKMRVRDVLAFFARLKGMRRCRAEIDHWLERLDLIDWADKKVDALSKGMSQKIQFIAAVVARPELLILDEPFSGLDPVNMTVLKDAILSLREHGTTIIFSTHDMDVAERMCDTIFMIYRGRKVLDGPLEAIQRSYGDDTLRVRLKDQQSHLSDLPGVTDVNDFGQYQELRIAPDADAQKILAALAQRGQIELFERTKPSLRDIFVRIAGPEVQADANGVPALAAAHETN